jgi:aspartokinase/homoserine dehydrogenase 1
VISIIGQDLSTFHKPYTALIKIKLFLFYSIILLPVKCEFSCEKSELNRALNVIHGEILGCQENKYHIWSWISGGTLINQILESAKTIEKRKDIKLNVLLSLIQKYFNKSGITNWKTKFKLMVLPIRLMK